MTTTRKGPTMGPIERARLRRLGYSKIRSIPFDRFAAAHAAQAAPEPRAQPEPPVNELLLAAADSLSQRDLDELKAILARQITYHLGLDGIVVGENESHNVAAQQATIIIGWMRGLIGPED